MYIFLRSEDTLLTYLNVNDCDLQNLENLHDEDTHVARLFKSLPSKDILYLAVLLHDIGKPISVAGHEIICRS